MKCSKCQQEKSIDNFTKDNSRKSGYSTHCKQCRLSWERKRRGVPVDKPNRKDVPKFNRAEYRKTNQWRNTAWSAMRRANMRKATPCWLTESQRKYIFNLYKQASELGKHVDHIVPLNNPKICGLHVPWNLQLLTPKDNLSKNNKLLT